LRDERERESQDYREVERKLVNNPFSNVKLVVLGVNELQLMRRVLFSFFSFYIAEKSKSSIEKRFWFG
jgi:hypothetical protein